MPSGAAVDQAKLIAAVLPRPSDGGDTDAVRQVLVDLGQKIVENARAFDRLMDDVRLSWQSAYAQRGVGSTFVRARMIASDVYDRGAPIPTVSASPDQNRFLRAVADLITDVAEELELTLE